MAKVTLMFVQFDYALIYIIYIMPKQWLNNLLLIHTVSELSHLWSCLITYEAEDHLGQQGVVATRGPLFRASCWQTSSLPKYPLVECQGCCCEVVCNVTPRDFMLQMDRFTGLYQDAFSNVFHILMATDGKAHDLDSLSLFSLHRNVTKRHSYVDVHVASC